MQVTSAQAWVKGEESALSRDESRPGAGTGRGSQPGFLPRSATNVRKAVEKSYPLVCPDREGVASRKESFPQLLERAAD